MALILCIDTATETALAGLSHQAGVIAVVTNEDQKNHAAFLQTGIQNLMQLCSVSFADIDAVAVVNGPGSYTGLRVGLASAKGICYALGKPLILLNTLEVMAAAAIEKYGDDTALYCPVIDARRDEVFIAVYNFSLHPYLAPQPLIIEENSLKNIPNQQKIFFFGSGHNKCEKIMKREKAVFDNVTYSLHQVNKLAQHCYFLKQFSDVAYAEPFYAKEFYLPGR